MTEPPSYTGQSPARTRPYRVGVALLLLAGGATLVAGWQLFWFLTDDAFIAFRYVSNSQLGRGYVWNPPPFLPVEGYTSFLWVALLDGVWRVTGLEPPVVSNWILLGCSLASLGLSARLWLHILRFSPGRHALLTLAVGLGFVVSNRTVLAWSSSGLETALFNLLLHAWACSLLLPRTPERRIARAAWCASLLALTRPDGLLFCATTGPLVLWASLAGRPWTSGARTAIRVVAPFGLVVAHVLWRRAFYGAWLPNTYYAKVTGLHWETGIVYLASFVLEYAVWLPLVFILCALAAAMGGVITATRRRRTDDPPAETSRPRWMPGACTAVAVLTILAHVGYYVLVVGGDHFEFRIFSHLPPLLFAALIWALAILPIPRRAKSAIMLATLLTSIPAPWTHWWLTNKISTRDQTIALQTPISPHWPAPVRWYADLFDRSQRSLISKLNCCRHQEHKIFYLHQKAYWPEREEGLNISGDAIPVLVDPCVGVVSWSLPHVSIIDYLGLNDYVVARTPPQHDYMAHSRTPPPGYALSFRPNVLVENRRVRVKLRDPPLDAMEVRQTEAYWRAWLDDKTTPKPPWPPPNS